jgi:hypothetical protein
MLLLHTRWEHICLAVKVPQLLVLAVAALPRITQSTRYEPYIVQAVHLPSNSIGDVLPLFEFELVRILAYGLPLLFRAGLVGGVEEGLPEVGDAED